MKTKEELNALKKEAETLNEKQKELTVEELSQISGGIIVFDKNSDGSDWKESSEEIVWHNDSDAGAGNDDKVVYFP